MLTKNFLALSLLLVALRAQDNAAQEDRPEEVQDGAGEEEVSEEVPEDVPEGEDGEEPEETGDEDENAEEPVEDDADEDPEDEDGDAEDADDADDANDAEDIELSEECQEFMDEVVMPRKIEIVHVCGQLELEDAEDWEGFCTPECQEVLESHIPEFQDHPCAESMTGHAEFVSAMELGGGYACHRSSETDQLCGFEIHELGKAREPTTDDMCTECGALFYEAATTMGLVERNDEVLEKECPEKLEAAKAMLRGDEDPEDASGDAGVVAVDLASSVAMVAALIV